MVLRPKGVALMGIVGACRGVEGNGQWVMGRGCWVRPTENAFSLGHVSNSSGWLAKAKNSTDWRAYFFLYLLLLFIIFFFLDGVGGTAGAQGMGRRVLGVYV